MLNQLELYNAKVIDIIEPSKFKCKCRFSHIFIYEKLEDWCEICQTAVFNKSLISEINSELDEMYIPLCVKKISKYGIATIKCKNNHIIQCDVDYIPNNCLECATISDNISQDEDSYISDSCCIDWFDRLNELSDSETFESISNCETFESISNCETFESISNCEKKYTKKIRISKYRENNINASIDIIIQFNKL